MHAFSVDYRKRDGAASSGGRVSRGFWLNGIPRPLILCRMFGHRPVVDGTTGFRDGDLGSRWVVCDRCGVRPDPQSSLDPVRWNIGDRYGGPWQSSPSGKVKRDAVLTPQMLPGPWPVKPTGKLGGQIVLGTRDLTTGVTLKVGNKGSEHTLAASFHVPWIGALYLHTERFGAGVVRRLNPVGYDSRVVELRAHDGHLFWRLWARRDHWSRSDPWWMHGSVQIDPRTMLLGPKRYVYTNHGSKVTETVRMPHGDSHQVQLQLQRCAFGRKRGRKKLSWSVDWEAPSGIPTKPTDRGRVYGSGVPVTDASVAAGTWQFEAAVRIAERMTEQRTRNDWRPERTATARS
ncbi:MULTISPECIES: hypothetical protein [unclassified Micromonospora]|uniref:hypothetical protein n=1 Tax=unclassified Micromonospora TaxID=2617518 RepID=UPI0033200FAD